MAIISLITDFGLEDEYVGLMKAVILGIDPLARLVDISHAVEPQDVVHAAFLLESAGRYFPPGSIHVAVVDPGVGTTRALICIEANGHRFLAPNNGLLSLVMDAFRPVSLRRLENATLWRSCVSATFHGRDILAPAAAHLSRGVLVRDLGPELDPADVVRLAELRAKWSPDGNIAGRIVHIDRFGNLVTNIDSIILQSSGGVAHERPVTIRLAGQAIIGIRRTYADAEPGRPVALIGSRGYLEIAVCCGSARSYFNVRRGDAVSVRPGG